MQHYKKIDEIPFDFMRRRMSVVVRNGDNQNLMVCKGAIEEMLPLCVSADDNGGAVGGVLPFTTEMRKEVRRVTRKLNQEGLRALAVGYKWLPPEDRTYTVDDEKDFVLAGYVAFLDPPKETARQAIAALREHGVAVKIITGDNEVVTRKICKEVGLPIEHALLGKDVEKLSDAQLEEAAELTTIFAKMSPVQKSRVIRALQRNGHTVGYLGDGINDAAALKDADVGISVDTAVDIAKESADIILLEKSLLVLEEAVVEGRKTFANIIKYIKMTASSNFGNVFSVLVASIFLPFLPMLPIQLLVQNLLYDISQVSIPWDDVDADFLKQPRKWDAGGIARFMVFIGPISSIFDIVTFLVMWNVFGANTAGKQSLFQSGWFVVGLLTQTLIVHMIRTQHIPFIQSRAATPVILLTASSWLSACICRSRHWASIWEWCHYHCRISHGLLEFCSAIVCLRNWSKPSISAGLASGSNEKYPNTNGVYRWHSIMCHDGTSTFSERSRLYVASAVIRLSTILLWLARRLYRARLLTFTDIRRALRMGETLRRLAWRLVR